MGSKVVPHVDGTCDVCGYKGRVLDFYGDYVCDECADKVIESDDGDSDEPAERVE